jgi:hypothetical protein
MKVMLPQNDEHKEHEDSRFCFQVIEHIKQRLILCGNSQVCVESVDDKAKVSRQWLIPFKMGNKYIVSSD